MKKIFFVMLMFVAWFNVGNMEEIQNLEESLDEWFWTGEYLNLNEKYNQEDEDKVEVQLDEWETYTLTWESLACEEKEFELQGDDSTIHITNELEFTSCDVEIKNTNFLMSWNSFASFEDGDLNIKDTTILGDAESFITVEDWEVILDNLQAKDLETIVKIDWFEKIQVKNSEFIENENVIKGNWDWNKIEVNNTTARAENFIKFNENLEKLSVENSKITWNLVNMDSSSKNIEKINIISSIIRGGKFLDGHSSTIWEISVNNSRIIYCDAFSESANIEKASIKNSKVQCRAIIDSGEAKDFEFIKSYIEVVNLFDTWYWERNYYFEESNIKSDWISLETDSIESRKSTFEWFEKIWSEVESTDSLYLDSEIDAYEWSYFSWDFIYNDFNEKDRGLTGDWRFENANVYNYSNMTGSDFDNVLWSNFDESEKNIKYSTWEEFKEIDSEFVIDLEDIASDSEEQYEVLENEEFEKLTLEGNDYGVEDVSWLSFNRWYPLIWKEENNEDISLQDLEEREDELVSEDEDETDEEDWVSEDEEDETDEEELELDLEDEDEPDEEDWVSEDEDDDETDEEDSELEDEDEPDEENLEPEEEDETETAEQESDNMQTDILQSNMNIVLWVGWIFILYVLYIHFSLKRKIKSLKTTIDQQNEEIENQKTTINKMKKLIKEKVNK